MFLSQSLFLTSLLSPECIEFSFYLRGLDINCNFCHNSRQVSAMTKLSATVLAKNKNSVLICFVTCMVVFTVQSSVLREIQNMLIRESSSVFATKGPRLCPDFFPTAQVLDNL